MTFDLVVSLGGYCQPGLQIRRWTARPPTFFDVLGTPFWGAKVFIECDGEGFLDEIFVTNQGQDVACVKYSIFPYHEVRRDIEGRVQLRLNELAHIQSSLTLRWRRLTKKVERARRVLFIRQHGYMPRPTLYTQYRHDPGSFTSGELWRMTQAIETRWPGLDYHLAFAYFPELGVWDFSTPLQKVSVHPFDYEALTQAVPPDLRWQGYVPDWDRLFTHFDIPPASSDQSALALALGAADTSVFI